MMASRTALAVMSKILEYTTTAPIPEKHLGAWLQVLAPLADELAIAATLRIARTERRCFAVAPGAIYQTALELLRERALSPGGAWGALGKALDEVADRKGWSAFNALPEGVKGAAREVGLPGLIDGRHLVADRARFVEFYRVINDRDVKTKLALPYSEVPAIGLSTGENPLGARTSQGEFENGNLKT